MGLERWSLGLWFAGLERLESEGEDLGLLVVVFWFLYLRRSLWTWPGLAHWSDDTHCILPTAALLL